MDLYPPVTPPDEGLPKKKQTRIVKTSPDWNSAKRKASRLSGQEYTTKSGKSFNRRNIEPIEQCKCQFKCTEAIPHETRVQINTKYYDLSNYAAQKHFIDKNVVETECHRKSAATSRRNYTLSYWLTGKQVCKTFFLKTLNITDSVVVRCKKKARLDGNSVEDLRGKHVVNRKRLDPVQVDLIRAHIKSFPMVESQNSRRDNRKMYLSSDLNLTKMYQLFKDIHPESPIKISAYRSIFNEYNLSFQLPKSDKVDKKSKSAKGSIETSPNWQNVYNE